MNEPEPACAGPLRVIGGIAEILRQHAERAEQGHEPLSPYAMKGLADHLEEAYRALWRQLIDPGPPDQV